jgi:hypothetical protein
MYSQVACSGNPLRPLLPKLRLKLGLIQAPGCGQTGTLQASLSSGAEGQLWCLGESPIL